MPLKTEPSRSEQTTKSTDKPAKAAGSATEGGRESRGRVADTLDSAADAAGAYKDALPAPLDRGADRVEDELGRASAYVRDHEWSEMREDAWTIARRYPIPTALIATGLVIGGGVIATNLMRSQRTDGAPSRGNFVLGLSPQTNQTVIRMRDAMLSLLMAKVVDVIEGRLPGFREHFDKA